MDELIQEELEIQDESVRPPRVLSADVFLQPIRLLCRDQQVAALPPSATIAEAILCMQERRFGAIVVTVEERLVGIVTERDFLFKVAGKKIDPERTPISSIMTENPETLMLDDPIAYLLNTMRVGGFRHVPIVDDRGRPVRLISVRDVLGHIVDHFPEEVINLPSQPFRGTPPQYGG
jgi:CBS-domain-containing membrane protein